MTSNHVHERTVIERLGEEVVATCLSAQFAESLVLVCRDQHDRSRESMNAKSGCGLQPVNGGEKVQRWAVSGGRRDCVAPR